MGIIIALLVSDELSNSLLFDSISLPLANGHDQRRI